ncbi:MAG: hypothetical protein M1528_03000 [Candidatus Marsarchaeota archaeon]|jgi:hypothetical protein|nr:hypothetical protein [Candidatus Marsarchaeota archaeon]
MEYRVLEKRIALAEARAERQRKAEEANEARWARVARRWLENEKAKHKEKLELSESILAWAKEFAASKEYGRVQMLLDNNEIRIFDGEWGHEPPSEYGSYGCWSHVSVRKDGSLEYWAGYKWTSSSAHILRSKEEMASKLGYNYLSELNDFLHSKRVWQKLGDSLNDV